MRTSEELEAVKLSSNSLKAKDSIISTASTENFANIETAPQIEEDIGSLKLKIELVKKNLETTLDSEDTLKNEFSNLNIEFESFLSETDYSQTDSFLISGNVQNIYNDIIILFIYYIILFIYLFFIPNRINPFVPARVKSSRFRTVHAWTFFAFFDKNEGVPLNEFLQ